MKLFELYERQALVEAKELSESIKLCEAVIKVLEDFDWEPQPEFRGAKGITTATGAGEKAARDAKQKQASIKLNDTWKKLLMKLKKQGNEGRKQLVPLLQKMAARADELGFTLSPDPSTILSKI